MQKLGQGIDALLSPIMAIVTVRASTTLLLTLENAPVAAIV